MKKQKETTQPRDTAENVGQLDETLTEITSTATEGIRKYRIPIVVAVSVVVLVVVGFFGLRAYEESQREALNAEFYRIFLEPVSRDAEPDPAATERFLESVQGDVAEPYFLRTVVTHHLRRADELEAEHRRTAAETASADGSSEDGAGADTAGAEGPPPPPAEVGELRSKALALAEEAALRRADAPSIQQWATNVEEKVEGATKEGWMPPPRRYRMGLPAE